VTDTGVTEYIPGPLRDACRRTRAHATLEVGGAEQAELWAAHRIGGRPLVRLEQVEKSVGAVASCAGWSTPDTLHRRHFQVVGDTFEIVDLVEGRRRSVRFALPLAPGLRAELGPAASEAQRVSAVIPLGDGSRLRIDLPQGVRWSIESTLYFPRFGTKVERACLVGEADAFSRGVWRFELEPA
jgi:hypothetical protein